MYEYNIFVINNLIYSIMEKRTITRFMAIFLMVMMAFGAFSQQLVPDFFNYQAIVRDSDGNIVADQSVTVRMTFMDGTTVVTTEDYMVSTNDYGLITLAADLLPAEFIGTYYADPSIKIEIDFGSGFVNLGENDLASVPYAMQAGNVATLNGNELTVGTGGTVTIPDAALVGQNAADIVTLQGQVLTIESTITLMGTTVADHTTRIEALENAGFITSETDPVFAASAAANINQVFINNWNMAYGWGNHATVGYLTSYTETDPVFGISIAATITGSDVGNWNMAYGWGDHSQAGYLTSFTESDPVFGVSVAASITGSDVTNWNMAYGWGDHSQVGYLTSFTELDPVFGVSVAAAITGSDVTNWDAAYGWGNHASVGYLTAETDPIFGVSTAAAITGSDVTNWNTAYGWGDHSLVGYLTSFTELDPVFGASIAAAITGSDVGNWNTAFGWGDHGIVGYLTAEADPYFVASTAYGITDSDVDNWDEAFGWGDHGLVGYLTAETDPFFVASTAYGITDSDVDNWDEAFGWGDHQPAITALQSELDVTQNGAGLTASGTYVADITSHYMQTATSLFNADQSLDNAIFSVNTQVNTNTSNISQNTSDIADNAAAIATNAANIAQNASDIDDNETAIAANAANIAQNASDIATNAAGIAANAAQIATNVVNIATNASGISSNFALIGANQVAIAQNASDIASNAVNIAQNASDISSTQAELDVTQVGAGLNPDGTYGTPTKAYNYIGTASSLFNADVLLDAQVKINEDNIAGNLLLIMDNADNIASNASDIVSNYNLINDNSHWIFDEDQDTYITVEETADEDKIHIYQDGTEVLRIPQKGVLEMLGKSLAIGEGSGINQVNAEGKNTFIGSYAGHNTTIGINNLFIGNSAGKANTSGSNNLYIGNEAGLLNAAGSENTFIGAASGRASQLNSGNTFIGARSGFSSDEGSNNTYIGINAGYNSDEGSSNVLIGANVGYELTTGEANTYIGNLAGYNSTTGYRNAYVGFQAGYYNSTGSHNTFLGNEAGYWETGSDKLYIANDRGGNLANGREVALIYGEFDNDILHLNAITTVTNTLQAGESPDHSIGDAAFIVDGGAYIYRNFYVNEQTFLDQTTIDVNDGEFLIHDGEGYPSASTNGIMADVNGYIGLVSSVNSGDAQTGIQTIDEDNRPTAAISINAVVGGVDIQAGDDIAIDAQTVYINGVDAAKGSNMAVGIGTDNTDGNIHIGHDTGDRIINIGLEDEGSAYTDEVNIEAEEINTFSENSTNIYAGEDVDIHAEEQVLVTAEATDNAVQGTGGADASIQFTTGAGGLDMNVGLDIAMDATNIYGAATESISLDAVTTSNFTVSTGDLQLQTSSADIYVDANDQVFITGDNATDATVGTTQTGAIQLTAVNGGVDVSAGLDVTVDAANTIYLNGGAAAKAAGLSVGIATDNTNGDVNIAFDNGTRDVRIGQYELTGAYTNQIIVGANTYSLHTHGNTTILSDAQIDMDAIDILGDATGLISFQAVNTSDFTVETGDLNLITQTGTVDVDAATNVEVTASNVVDVDAGDNIFLTSAGTVDAAAGTGDAAAIQINAPSGGLDMEVQQTVAIDATDIVGTTSQAISWNAVTNSNFTVETGDLTLDANTANVYVEAATNIEETASADILLTAGDDAEISAGDHVLIDADGTVDAAVGTGTNATVQINSDGGIDMEADLDVAIDAANTIYLNGGAAAKAAGLAVSIGSDDTNGDIYIAYDEGVRDVNIGQYEAAGSYTNALTIGANTLNSHTHGATSFVSDDNVVMTASETMDLNANIIDADATLGITLDAGAASHFVTSAGNLLLDAEAANVVVDGHTGVYVDATGTTAPVEINATGLINIGNDNVNQNINMGTAGNRTINIGNDGATLVDVNATDIYLDAGNNVDIDAADVVSIDAVNTSNFTVSTGDLDLITTVGTVDIDAGDNVEITAASDVDIDGTNILADATDQISLDAVNTSNFTVSTGDLQLYTGIADVDIDAADQFLVDADGTQDAAAGTGTLAAIQLTSAGGIDLEAADDIAIDGTTVYINGVDAAKGTNLAIGIGTDNTSGNIQIGYDQGARNINIGQYEAAGGYTSAITIGGNTLTSHTYSNTDIETEANMILDAAVDIDMDAGHDLLITVASDVDIDGTNILVDASALVNIQANRIQAFADDYIQLDATNLMNIDGDNVDIDATTDVFVTGGNDVDIDAFQDVTIDGNTVFINGSAAKGTNTAIGIGTTSNSGNIEIGTAGNRVIAIGSSVADVLGMDAEVVEIDAETSMDLVSNGTMTMSSAEAMALNSAKGFTLYGAESSSIGSGINLSVDANTNLNLGTVEADAINVGQSGIPTNIDGTLDVDEGVVLHSTLDVDGATTLDQTTITTSATEPFTVNGTGVMDVNVATDVSGILTVSNATPSGGYTSGALLVAGGVGIGEDLYVNQNLFVDGQTHLDQTTINTTDGQFTVNGTGTTFIEPDGAAFFRSRTNTVYIGDGTTAAVSIGTATNTTGVVGHFDVDGITNLDRTNILTNDGAFTVSGTSGISFTVTGDVAMTPTGSVNINPTVGTNIGTTAGAIEIGRTGINTSVNGSMTVDQNFTATGDITTTGGYFNGIVGATGDRDLIWGSTITGTTITDGTASLNAGALTGITSISASGNITTTGGYFNGVLGASGDADAAFVTDIEASSSMILDNGSHRWRIVIDGSGNLDFDYWNGTTWVNATEMVHP
jgi:hypothetical protein